MTELDTPPGIGNWGYGPMHVATESGKYFIGLPMPQTVVDMQSRLKKIRPNYHWKKPENLHLTLAFLGWRIPKEIGAIQVLLRNVPVPEATLAVAGLGYFAGPRCLWGTPVGKLSKVFALAAAIKEAVAPVVRTPTLRTPHITLAEGVNPWWEGHDTNADFQREARTLPWVANGFTLYHSVDGVYSCIEHYGERL